METASIIFCNDQKLLQLDASMLIDIERHVKLIVNYDYYVI